jgi:hypothetical protein
MLVIALAWYERRKRYEGEVLLLFALAYLWSTWLLEHVRAEPHLLTQQLVLLGGVAITVIAAAVEWRRHAGRAAERTAATRAGALAALDAGPGWHDST